MSPFYDAECAAIRRLIDLIHPASVFVYLQEGRTSVDLERLMRIGESGSAAVRFVPCRSAADEHVYLHAKAYLARTATRDICLSGSPNCSVAALMMASPVGNTELGSLATLPRGELDDLFEGLKLGTATERLQDFEVVAPELFEENPSQSMPKLTGCAAESDELVLEFDRALDGFGLQEVRLRDQPVDAEVLTAAGSSVRLRVRPAMPVLDKPTVLTLVFTIRESELLSQSLFLCNLGSLAALSRRCLLYTSPSPRD